ncbi:MAG TPA: T9SS type A sorting domain-containing protein, partial [Bacteroidetes bacterium]|nr:T9SS type A sorting domain-containing protein [Bacteroidota bacterium]
KEGNYNVVFRIASLGYNGGLKMFLISENGDKQEVLNTSFSPTGGWQAWKSFESSAYLPKGEYILRLVITKPQFNINWFRFDFISGTQQTYNELATLIYPNPFNDYIFINNEVNTDIDIQIFDLKGNILIRKSKIKSKTHKLFLKNLNPGIYFLQLNFNNRSKVIKLVKTE